MSSDAKKTPVKEKFKARPGIGRIMPEKGNELVPVQNTQATTIEELKLKTTVRQNTLVRVEPPQPQASAPRRMENTQLTQYGTFVYEKPTTEKIRKPAPKRRDRTPFIFLGAALALALFVALDETPQQVPTMPTKSPFAQGASSDEVADRAELHRKLTGWKMNRERVDQQFDNFRQPGIAYDAPKVKGPDVMSGVPIEGEGHPRMYDAQKPNDINPDYPDTRIQYGLKEEQDAQEYDARVQKEFVNDFIENARREGYDLRVDKFGNVQVKRAPSQYDPNSPGASR